MKNKSHKPETSNKSYGTLYVVSTPIGNLEDITLRALEILKKVNLIAAENIRHTKILGSHYGINTPLTSYHQHNRKSKAPELVAKLKAGSDIALITNAGTPGVSDPGATLISLAHDHNIKVSPIPGPSAVIAALSVCGLRIDRFLFMGFLSSRSGKRKKEIRELTNEQRTMIFYEAPHRIKAMLTDLRDILGARRVVILRELTKVYEEVKRGHIGSILEDLDDKKIQGEITVVVAGRGKTKKEPSLDQKTKDTIKKLLINQNMGVKDVAIKISEELDLNYRSIYRECITIKKQIDLNST